MKSSPNYNLLQESTSGNRQNSADDMQNCNMLSKSHPFLKETVQSAGKPSNVICYTDYTK